MSASTAKSLEEILFGESSSDGEEEEDRSLREGQHELKTDDASESKEQNPCDDHDKGGGDVFDRDAFEKEWAQAEREWEDAELEREKARQEKREREAQAEQRWSQKAMRYQKHPPRETDAEKRNDSDKTTSSCYNRYSFSGVYPQLFRVAKLRIERCCRGYRYIRDRITELRGRQIEQVPCSAEVFYKASSDTARLSYHGWTPWLLTVLKGTRSTKKAKKECAKAEIVALPSSPLSLLRDYEDTLVRYIFSYLPSPFAKHVIMTIPADVVMNYSGRRQKRFGLGGRRLSSELTSSNHSYTDGSGFVAFATVGQVLDLFPLPTGRNVNMMPFELGNKQSLPDDLQCYYPLIDACPFFHEEFGKVAYLTVHESAHCEAGSTQRRPGLHIESPGVFADKIKQESNDNSNQLLCSFTPGEELHHWGRGSFGCPDRFEGGIYLASNVGDSTALWDALVDSSIPGIADRLGGIDHLSPLLPDSNATKLRAGELVWMTDCTPHKALPQTDAGPRTFFRLVMPNVTHWYAAHSTPNPKVPVPDSVTIIDDCKFVAAGTMSIKPSS